MKDTIELAIGQVYIEDLGAGKQPNRIEIIGLAGEFVRYRTVVQHSMLRNRFEGLVKSGVFVMVDAAPAKNGMEFRSELEQLRYENQQLKALFKASVTSVTEYRKRLKSIQDITFLAAMEPSPL